MGLHFASISAIVAAVFLLAFNAGARATSGQHLRKLEMDGVGYSYIGCYEDYPEPDRVFDYHRTDTEKETNHVRMSPNYCYSICKNCFHGDQPAVYFGTQNGNECYCTADPVLPALTWLDNSKCDVPCLSDANETCGGHYKLSLYKITS